MIDPTTREERLHKLLGLRPHREGCPGEHLGGGRLEAWQERVVAPSNELRHLKPGAHVSVVRCLECNGVRYLEGHLDVLLDQAGAA
jgi:hypothetical protein